MKMYCTKCGKRNEEDAEFCVYCGHELITGMDKTPMFGDKEELVTEPRKKITIVTGLLLALLGIWLVGCLFMTFEDPIFGLDLVVYLVAIVGVSLKAKWGSLLALGYHVLAFLMTPIIYADASAAFIAGALIMDLLIAGLAWKEYSSLKVASERVKKESALQTA
jgi:hypothetical protein